MTVTTLPGVVDMTFLNAFSEYRVHSDPCSLNQLDEAAASQRHPIKSYKKQIL